METKEIKQTKTKKEIMELLDANHILYSNIDCNGNEQICIPLDDMQSDCYKSPIILQTSNKDVYKVYPHEILYIAIENRKSVLYLKKEKVETNYHLDHWKSVLDKKVFVQPHYSYIVNLNYVYEITKNAVKIRWGINEYSVYASSRKIVAFKNAMLKFWEKSVM